MTTNPIVHSFWNVARMCELHRTLSEGFEQLSNVADLPRTWDCFMYMARLGGLRAIRDLPIAYSGGRRFTYAEAIQIIRENRSVA